MIYDGKGNQFSVDTGIGGFFRLFRTVGIIGDSLSAGYITQTGSTAKTSFQHSWAGQIIKKYGITAKNYAQAGLSVVGWFDRFESAFDSDNACDCYFVGLMTNRVTGLNIGDASDSTDTESFCGYYKKIVEKIRGKNANACIFCLSSYMTSSTYTTYSNAVSSICGLYENCFFVNLVGSPVDMTGNDNAYGHYNAIGYVEVANYIETVIDGIVLSEDYFKSYINKLL